MAQKFDEFSKHLAKKQTRRGALKFLGAGLISAFIGTVFSRSVDAGPRNKYSSFFVNKTYPAFNYTIPPQVEETLTPYFNYIVKKVSSHKSERRRFLRD